MSPDGFQAMGVDVVVGGATEPELEAVGFLFEKLERTFSRFRPDSELNRVNAATAEFVAASPNAGRRPPCQEAGVTFASQAGSSSAIRARSSISTVS
jgi:hypothetical protein